MAVARDYVLRAMRLLGLVAPGEAPTASELADGVAALNVMLSEWRISGKDVGVSEYGPDDEVYCPDAFRSAIGYCLALEIAPEYGVQPSPMVLQRAEEGKRLIEATQAEVREMTVPTGLWFGLRRGWNA